MGLSPQIEYRCRCENPSIKPDIKEMYKNIKQCYILIGFGDSFPFKYVFVLIYDYFLTILNKVINTYF